jgi:hypothetical protein
VQPEAVDLAVNVEHDPKDLVPLAEAGHEVDDSMGAPRGQLGLFDPLVRAELLLPTRPSGSEVGRRIGDAHLRVEALRCLVEAVLAELLDERAGLGLHAPSLRRLDGWCQRRRSGGAARAHQREKAADSSHSGRRGNALHLSMRGKCCA